MYQQNWTNADVAFCTGSGLDTLGDILEGKKLRCPRICVRVWCLIVHCYFLLYVDPGVAMSLALYVTLREVPFREFISKQRGRLMDVRGEVHESPWAFIVACPSLLVITGGRAPQGGLRTFGVSLRRDVSSFLCVITFGLLLRF